MYKEFKKITGLIVLIGILAIIVCAYSGADAVVNLFFSLIKSIGVVVFLLWQIFVGFLPYFDFNDWIICATVFFGILFAASIGGTVYSAKQKSKLWTGICTAFDLITLLGAIFSASHLK